MKNPTLDDRKLERTNGLEGGASAAPGGVWPGSSWLTIACLALAGILANGLCNSAIQPANAQEKSLESSDEVAPELVAKLEKYLSGATLKGKFTILGREIEPKAEEYSIVEAKKLDSGDLWGIKARVKYGKVDQTFSIPMEIKWADKTPVITLERTTIPGMGTFSARVLFNNGMYSGTWQHDEVKGHLFGEVIPAKEDSSTTEDSKSTGDQ